MTLLLLASLSAHAQDLVPEISYEGSLSQSAAGYVAGKPVSVTHNGGNISVRCMDTPNLSARLKYVVFGTQEGPMESMGNGIGLAASGDSKGGRVSTRVPSKPSGVKRADIELTVNIPSGTSALTVSQTGDGWVQVLGCGGNVKVSAGKGGAYVSGGLTQATVGASGGDVKVVQEGDTVFTGATTLTSFAGNATLELSTAQGGKLKASGTEVSYSGTVIGTNSSTLIDGDMGVAGPLITVTAPKGTVTIKPNN